MMSSWYTSNKNYVEQSEIAKKAQKELSDAKEKQTNVMNELERLETEMNRMQKELKDKKYKLAELESDLAIKKNNLEIAEKLVSGLGDEKVSWNAEKKQLGIMYEKLVGDSMLSCAFLT